MAFNYHVLFTFIINESTYMKLCVSESLWKQENIYVILMYFCHFTILNDLW